MLDLLSLPLALGLGAGGKRLSGILFRPSVHYGAIGPYKAKPWASACADGAQGPALPPDATQPPRSERMLTLDPFFPDHCAQSLLPTATRWWRLPESRQPTGRLRLCDRGGRLSHQAVASASCCSVYLHRAQRPARGARCALFLLPHEVAARVAVLFRPDGSTRLCASGSTQRPARRTSRKHHPDLWFRIDDRRLDQAELRVAGAAKATSCWPPTQRFVGSSGVLLWAAISGRAGAGRRNSGSSDGLDTRSSPGSFGRFFRPVTSRALRSRAWSNADRRPSSTGLRPRGFAAAQNATTFSRRLCLSV